VISCFAGLRDEHSCITLRAERIRRCSGGRLLTDYEGRERLAESTRALRGGIGETQTLTARGSEASELLNSVDRSLPEALDASFGAASPGELIGRYQLLSLLGAGGAGEVYIGHDTQLERPVAIKRLRPELASSADRVQLAHEARINARLEHPNIVRVYDFLSVAGADYIVSEYVAGTSLADPACVARADLDRQLRVALAICRGLAFAHEAGVVHLDLKSENVLVARDGVPKIADFGIAQRVESGARHEASGVVIRGTFRSMSPEQTLASPAAERSDLFSFGTLLYELFSGVSPFHVRGHSAETIRRVREHTPLPLRELRSAVPPALSELVQRLHRKAPRERPASAREVEAVLAELVERRARTHGANQPALERRLLTLLTCEPCLGAPSQNLEDTEIYLRTLARFRELVAQRVESHEGHVLSVSGQRAVICMGYPRAHDNNCERAARLFLELRRDWREDPLGESCALRAGLDLGETLLAGELAAGPALLASAALCDAARPSEFLVSSRAQRLLRRFFDFIARGDLALPGAAQAGAGLPYHELCDPEIPRSLPLGFAQACASELIGRDAELGVLADAWSASQASKSSTLLVLGAPGVGKSRLIRAFAERAACSGARVLSLRGRPEDQYSPFAPFAQLLSPLKLPNGDAPPSRVRGVEGSALGSLLDALAGTPANATAAGGPSSPDNYRQRVLDEGLARLLGPIGAEGLLLIVEDVHWLDHSSLALLRSLEQRGPEPGLLLLLSGRPECSSTIQVLLSPQLLQLDRLNAKGALELIQSVPGMRQLPHRMVTRILEGADGLPLLLEELTLSSVESSRLGDAQQQLLEAPSSLTESLERRLQALGSARETANILAALGRESLFAILEKIAGHEAPELEAQLAQLAAAGLVLEEGAGGERRLVFRHVMLRDAIYERLPIQRREELHRRIAAVAQASFPASLGERPDLFAVHFARSGQWHEAIELSVRAGERAALRSCHFEACAHFRSALELLARWDQPEQQKDRWELHIRRLSCPSLNASDGWAAPAVEENNRGLATLAARLPAPKPLPEIWASFAHACLRHDASGVSEALACASDRPDTPELRAVLAVAHGNAQFYRAEFALAEHSFLTAEQLLSSPEVRDAAIACGQELAVEVPAYLAWIHAVQGQEQRAIERRREAEQCAPTLIVARSFGLMFSTSLGLMLRDHESASGLLAQRARSEQLLELAEQLRHPVFQAVAEIALGRLRMAEGALEAGLSGMLRGYELYAQTGAQLCLTEFAGFVLEAHLEAGQIARARDLIERVREPGGHEYARFYRAELARLEVELLLAERRPREARRVLEFGLECVAVRGTAAPPRLLAARLEQVQARLNQIA
jgi:serine/threonine protein kinase